jgi:hypothetical protein
MVTAILVQQWANFDQKNLYYYDGVGSTRKVMVLLECENTLVGIFIMVIATAFKHTPAENCRRYRFLRIQCSSSTVMMIPKVKIICKEGHIMILFLVSAGTKAKLRSPFIKECFHVYQGDGVIL